MINKIKFSLLVLIIGTILCTGTIYADQLPGAPNVTCGSGITDLTSLINFFSCTLINSVSPLLVSLAVISFVYGIIQYFLYPDNEEKRKQGKTFMFWGIVTLFVMVSIWGLVGIFSSTFLNGKTLMPGLPQ